jgi:hypothetical protein
MKRTIQRIKSHLATPAQAQEKISDLLIELRHRGIKFEVQEVNEEGEHYFFAQSVGYPRGTIFTTGKTQKELELMIKDAIFTAFGIPPRYCNPDLINLEGLPKLPSSQVAEKPKQTYSAKIYATT